MAGLPIIGTGAVCAAGYGVSTGFNAVVRGDDGLLPLTLFDSELKETPLCGQVPEGPLPEAPNRTTALALFALNEALSAIPDRKQYRLGIVLATTVAGMTQSEQFYRKLRTSPAHSENAARELACHEPTAVTGFCASKVQARGFHTLSTACSTGLHALGMAKRLIEQGTYDLCCAVGTDALSMLTIRGFASLMLIDFSGCKPFDARRIGISLGEGAGAVLLASQKVVNEQSLLPLAAMSGWGASADAHHMTAPHPEGQGAIRAATAALQEAQCSPSDISMIVAHGTATPDNDVSEIKAMRSVFDPVPPFCSMKRSLGHTLAASGTLETVFAVRALQENHIPATAGFEQEDSAIGISPASGEKKELNHILKNAFGFGGNNAAVIVSKWDAL